MLKKLLMTFFWLLFLIFGVWLGYLYFRSKTTPSYPKTNQIKIEKDWTDIHLDFKNDLVLKDEWTEKGFSYEQTKEWITVGLKPKQSDFASWLNQKGYSPEKVLNYGNKENLEQQYNSRK